MDTTVDSSFWAIPTYAQIEFREDQQVFDYERYADSWWKLLIGWLDYAVEKYELVQ